MTQIVRWLEQSIDGFRPADGPPPQTLMAFFRWSLSGAWPVILLGCLVSGLAGALEAVSAFILGAVIDATVTATPQGFFVDNWALLLGFVAFFLIARPMIFGSSAAFNGIAIPPNVYPLVQSRLHRWSLGQDVTFFDNDFAGRLAQKQVQTANAVTNVITEMVNVGAFAIASVIGSLLLLLSINGWVAVLLLGWLGLYALLFRYFMPRVRQRSKARAAARSSVTGQVVDTITNIKTVKLFAHDRHEDAAALNAMADLRDRSYAFGHMSTAFRFALMTVAGLLPILLIGATVLLWQAGLATAGEIVAAGSVSIRLGQMTGWVSFTLMAVYANVGEVEDGMNTLTKRPQFGDAPDAVPLQANGPIVFDDVQFAYGGEVGGLHGVSLTVSEGERLGIVGASGAGKSTLVSLLLRLYDVEGGRVTIGGQDVRHVTQESLRQRIGMVTQETAMFNRSARDNILYGRPDATEGQMISAAQRAEAHAFIQDLRDFKDRTGYDAYLGERGVKLSGGQRQRIALARAVLKDAPILVLDEATSALDSEVEAAIQSALERVMEGKTVIAIAHRLSTLTQMDRIIVLDQGQIVEEGTHSALLAQDGLYARYWARQSGGFLKLDAAE